MSANEIERDAKLIERALDCDETGFNELQIIYQQRVFWFAYLYLMNSEDAKDITQDTFFTLLRNLRNFDSTKPLITYLFSITFNIIRNHKRKNIKMETMEKYDRSIEASQEQTAIKNEVRRLILEELKNFDPETRIILMEHLDEKNFSEIGELLTVPVATVKTRIFRAHERLKKALSKFL